MGRVARGRGFLIRLVRHVTVAIVATVPGQGLGLTSDLFLLFPVAGVDALREAVQVLELSWLAYVADFVFDAVSQTGIKLVTKGGVAITLELRREAVELHDVANDSLRVLHPQVVELVLGISNGVMRAELELEFCDELAPIVHPEGTIIRVEGTEEVGFEPLERHTFEVQLHECDFGSIRVKGTSPVLEVELTLHQKGTELLGVGTIEGVWFADASTRQLLKGGCTTQ